MREARHQLIAGYKTLAFAVALAIGIFAASKIAELSRLNLDLQPGVGVAFVLAFIALLLRGAGLLLLGSARTLRQTSAPSQPAYASRPLRLGAVVAAAGALWVVWRVLHA